MNDRIRPTDVIRTPAASGVPDAVRAIAFYLPQYHPIPENDRWWGEGFTEWTNVRKAVPNFFGHEQPHLPGELGYYDLRDPAIRDRQAALARAHGLHGFCYYTYWFNGHRLLQRPLDAVLASGKPDFPFCLCWANENWTRRWDGLDREILMAQSYSREDSRAFLRAMLPALSDPRYIKVDGRLLLLVYKIDLVPHARAMAEIWREEASRAGLPELYLAAVRTSFASHPTAFGFDAAVEFPPHAFRGGRLNARLHGVRPEFRGVVFNYRDQVVQALDQMPADYPVFRCVMPAWDNTARRQLDATVFTNASPEAFEYWTRAMVVQTRRRLAGEERLLFVNAWNEWGEGCYLEPDQRRGRQYLLALQRALSASSAPWPMRVAWAGPPATDALDALRRLPGVTVERHGPYVPSDHRAPQVSVVMPVHNHARFVAEAIGSVLGQSHLPSEVIAIDDGSTDGSFDALRLACAGASCRVVLVRQPNAGAAAALNRGLALAGGDIIALLNSDDAYVPDRLERMVEALQREEAEIAFSRVAFVDGDGAPVPQDDGLLRELETRVDAITDYPDVLYAITLSNVAISTGNLVFRRRLLEVTGGFRDLRLTHDWDFLLAASYAGRIAYVPTALYRYRLHDSNSFAPMRLHAAEESEAAYRRFFADIDVHPGLRDPAARACYLRFAHAHGCRGYFAVPPEWRYCSYDEWVALHASPGPDAIAAMRVEAERLSPRPRLSLLLPTYNSDLRWLRRCLDSVLAQAYLEWELCIADDASTEPELRALLEEYRGADPRIRVVYRSQNGHIARATNSALELATGEIAVLLDHDDELAPDALLCVARELLAHPDAMLIYSDEDKIGENGIRTAPYFKPDWNPALLRGQNCVSHLGAVRTSLLREIGGFRPGLEGAQDWDVALRVGERCRPEQIRHIPRVLYHWRLTAGSTAQGMERKSYASAAQRRALAEHLERTGRTGVIALVADGLFWRIDYALERVMTTTVIVDGRGDPRDLQATLAAIAVHRATQGLAVLAIVDGADTNVAAAVAATGATCRLVHAAPGEGRGAAWNRACASATTELVLLLLAGVVPTGDAQWLERLAGHAQWQEIGAVAPYLVMPDNTIHGAGAVIDAECGTSRLFVGRYKGHGAMGARDALTQNLTVPGVECLLFKRGTWIRAEGFDTRYGDLDLLSADFCLRLREQHAWNVVVPDAECEWRGPRWSPWKPRDAQERERFLARWKAWAGGDPAYNPNLDTGARTGLLRFDKVAAPRTAVRLTGAAA